jgi:3-methyl-2-oxobutanoate hydroxymethyltransferase
MDRSMPDAAGPPVTTTTFREMKADGVPLVMVTAYDVAGARLVDRAGVDAVLVGDSLGMTVLGHADTLRVTMDDMVRHTAAVARGCGRAMVIADMPFMSFQVSPEDALVNAGRLVAEGGAAAVKLEGGRRVAETVRRIVEAGIPVLGHVGLTPQSVHAMGGYSTQAKETAAALELVEDCLALERAGAFAIVLECIPAELAERVTARLSASTIGIGAGTGCDGQVQVFHDLLGLGERVPRHAQAYAELGDAGADAVGQYAADVRGGGFPREEHATRMDAGVLSELDERLAAASSASEEE